MSVIRFEELHKTFPGQEETLKGVNLDIPRGLLTYILGTSGAGKSILLKHILGLMQPTSGTVFVEGQNLNTLSRSSMEKLRFSFGMLFQNSALFDPMTVFENVAFPLIEHTTLTDQEIYARVSKSLTILGMAQGWEKYPNQLSGGMKKRVALARAIIREPSILLYDEPTTGLDPVNRAIVDELIATLKSQLKLTSIVISHDITSALLLADRIAFLHAGKIEFFGTPQEFKQSASAPIQQFIHAERRLVELWVEKD